MQDDRLRLSAGGVALSAGDTVAILLEVGMQHADEIQRAARSGGAVPYALTGTGDQAAGGAG